ncbi:DgyrCDS6113 [Dimorphilus gyrociliatus]|uniref:DgyrCDS6113 n=1 Tax=Dimorphilus gyrociliatus TaxID=2664684 RepID=A0A7I8VRV4_9ANNE|nr:DgyrCDS6113 [Dimorphilus gyrociliatus]
MNIKKKIITVSVSCRNFRQKYFNTHYNMLSDHYILTSVLIIVGFIFLSHITPVEGQYDDVRCICVCPKNTTEHPVRKVSVLDPGDCQCDKVVNPPNKEVCKTCECKWQRRNTTTIKVVVIIIICIMGILTLYLLFLLCLDPLMSKRPRSYLEHHDEEVNLVTIFHASVTHYSHAFQISF